MHNLNNLEKNYLTRAEIALRFRISLPTLHKHTKNGLPSIKIGKRRIYNLQVVEHYLDSMNKK
jgi:hypothetical protein